MNRLLLRYLLPSLLMLAGVAGYLFYGHQSVVAPAQAAPFTLTILHINDHHSHLQESLGQLQLGNQRVEVAMGGFPRVTALIKQLSAGKANLLKLHAGDATTGDLYYTLFRGEADAALMNTVCFDAMAAGNHEFDNHDAGLSRFIDFLHQGACKTPVLAANVVPEPGVSPLAPKSGSYLQPYTLRQFGPHQVGIIGLVTAAKTKNSSSPDASTRFLDEAQSAQRYIDELSSKGVDQIILLTHYGYQADQAMAARLNGVDVIVGGDSHSLLGSGFSQLGLNPEGEYPTQVKDAMGRRVCIVQAWQYADLLGELNVTFDAKGEVQRCAGQPHLLIGSDFRLLQAPSNPALASQAQQAVVAKAAATSLLAMVTPDPAAQHVLDSYAAEVESKTRSVVGKAKAPLCFARVPGDDYSTLCSRTATRAHGSEIGNLVAQAFLAMSPRAELAIQNGGGVRGDVPAGDITIGSVYRLLPFANTLINLNMTGAEIRQTLNEAVDAAVSATGESGAYPYAAGLRFDVDLSRMSGSRVYQIETRVKGSAAWVPLDEQRNYIVVSNSFIAAGKDHYQILGKVSASGRAENTYLDYADAFVEFVKAHGELGKPAEEEYSTRHFYDAKGQLQQ